MSAQNDTRVLVLAPVGRDAQLASDALARAGLKARACRSLDELCSCMREGAAVTIVGEEALTPNAISCIRGVLADQPSWSDLPFLILTTGGRSTELSLSHVALIEKLGHVTLLERPIRFVTLITAVRAGLRSRQRQYELRDRIEALHASERRFRSCFEHAAVGMAMISQDGKFLEVNSALAEITGYSPDELVRMSFTDITHPDEQERSEQLHKQLITGELPYITTEKRYIRKTGDPIWVRLSASVVRDEGSNPMNTISLVEEITYRRQAEDALAAQAAELARSNADLQQFAWVTSHDLREPIRTLIAFSQLLQTRYRNNLDEQGAQALDFIQTSAKRMDSLVRDLLTYSRVVNTEQQAFSRVSLNSALDWAVSNMQATIKDAHAIVRSADLPEVVGDEVQLVQLLQNLLSNAVKYAMRPDPVVEITAAVLDGEVEVSVKDNGAGIDPRYHERVFGLFKRLHGADVQGTGLGLAICRKIVERHGGRIWVESQPGQGATFKFTLPAAAGN
jgi:PAS domain S-box-containing protein